MIGSKILFMGVQVDRLTEITNNLHEAEDIYIIGPFCEVENTHRVQMLVAPKLPRYNIQTLNDFQSVLSDRFNPDGASLAKIAPGGGDFISLGFLRFNLGTIIKGKSQYFSDCFVNIYPSPELVDLALNGTLIRDLIKVRALYSPLSPSPVQTEGRHVSEKYGGWDTLYLTQNIRLMSDNLFSNKISAGSYKVFLETYLTDVISACG